MKKLILGLSLMTFLVFGVVGVQSVVADNLQVSIENVDNTPDKDKDKDKDSKKAKTEKKEATSSSTKDGECSKYNNCCKKSCSDKSGSKEDE